MRASSGSRELDEWWDFDLVNTLETILSFRGLLHLKSRVAYSWSVDLKFPNLKDRKRNLFTWWTYLVRWTGRRDCNLPPRMRRAGKSATVDNKCPADFNINNSTCSKLVFIIKMAPCTSCERHGYNGKLGISEVRCCIHYIWIKLYGLIHRHSCSCWVESETCSDWKLKLNHTCCSIFVVVDDFFFFFFFVLICLLICLLYFWRFLQIKGVRVYMCVCVCVTIHKGREVLSVVSYWHDTITQGASKKLLF